MAGYRRLRWRLGWVALIFRGGWYLMTLWSRLRRRHESKGFLIDGLDLSWPVGKLMEKSACISFFVRKNQNDI